MTKATKATLPLAGGAAEEVTSEEAAELLHVSRNHVSSLVASGQLGGVRLTPDGHRRLSRASVLKYRAKSKAGQVKALDALH